MKTYERYNIYIEGKGKQLNEATFLTYYQEHIQDPIVLEDSDGKDITLEGPTPKSFFEYLFDGSEEKAEKYRKDVYNKIVNDKKLDVIQEKLEKKGIECCMINMYYLCSYIKYSNTDRYFILLSPQIKDTLSEIKKLSSITFTNTDGSSTTSYAIDLIETVLEALKAKSKDSENNYTAFKMVNWEKITNKEIIQSIFIHELSLFLHSFFPIHRRGNATVTPPEQELIMYFLKLFGYATEMYSPSRFRQLKGIYDKIKYRPSIKEMPLEDGSGEHVFLDFDFVKYELWKKGRIDFKSMDIDDYDVCKTVQYVDDFQVDVDY